MPTKDEVLINEMGPSGGVRFLSGTYAWSEDASARLGAVMSEIFGWKRQVVIDGVWVSNLKRTLGVEVERVVKQAIANNAPTVLDLNSPRYDVCTDWIIDKAIAELRRAETFNDGGGI